MIRIWITGLALIAGLGVAGAQGAQNVIGSGRVITAPYFDEGHMLLFSQGDRVYGTSRSAAMGGAFASLGADLSSMNINPAGLGMYQSSDWGFTQALTIDRMGIGAGNMAPGALREKSGGRTAYGLNNVAAAYNIFNRSGALTSLTIGFGYNRLANFNSRTRISTVGENSSIADMFARQLGSLGMSSGQFDAESRPFENLGIDLDKWGAVMAWQTGLVGIDQSTGDYGYFEGAIPSDSYFGSVTRGGIHEYSVSLGANVSNLLYVGATLGTTRINFDEETSYEEFYGSGAFSDMWIDQNTSIIGNGFTAKLGAIVRPLPALRLGVAFHLPTYYTIEKSYQGAMGVTEPSGTTWRADTGNLLVDTQMFNTAPKLMAGISAIVADRAIVALDWEAEFFNKIRQRSDFRDVVDRSIARSGELYKPAHTVRAGVEFLMNDVVSLRAGGAWKADFLRDGGYIANNPAGRHGFNVTGGVGFNIGRNGYVDAAYVFSRSRMTDFESWFYDADGAGGLFTAQYDVVGGADVPRTYTPTRNRHMITLTLGSRF